MKCVLLALLFVSSAASANTDRAADGDEVVLNRLYPKTKTFELEVSYGFLLNPTYVDTTLAQVATRYHWSESWGVGISYAMAQTKDRDERACVESFYNDPKYAADAPCQSQDGGAGLDGEDVNIGPAYPRIRELRAVIGVFGDYTLAYGKQILLHGVTSHFDLRLRFGAAAVLSEVYAERAHVRGKPDRPSRGATPDAGVEVDESDEDGLLWGEEGRPVPTQETSAAFFGAVAQEMHFARRFFVLGELGAYLMPSSEAGLESFFVVSVGAGVRF